MDDIYRWYQIIGIFLGWLTVLIIWISTFFVWGFLIGLAIGWLPGIIGGMIIRWLWPLPAAVFAIIILLITLNGGW